VLVSVRSRAQGWGAWGQRRPWGTPRPCTQVPQCGRAPKAFPAPLLHPGGNLSGAGPALPSACQDSVQGLFGPHAEEVRVLLPTCLRAAEGISSYR